MRIKCQNAFVDASALCTCSWQEKCVRGMENSKTSGEKRKRKTERERERQRQHGFAQVVNDEYLI